MKIDKYVINREVDVIRMLELFFEESLLVDAEIITHYYSSYFVDDTSCMHAYGESTVGP